MGQGKWHRPYCVKNCLLKQVGIILVDKAQLIKEVQDCTDAFIATIEWRTEEGLEVLKVLPNQYYKWAGIFSREQTNKLPEHTKYDHKIKLVEGAEATWGPLNGMTEQELRGLPACLDRQVEVGKIIKSHSSAEAPRLLVNKSDSSFRLWVDY